MILALHAMHAGIVVAGLAALAYLWRASRRPAHRVAELHRAAAGGRLVEAAEARARAQLLAPTGTDRPGPWLLVAAGTTLLAGAVHAAVSPEHYTEGWRFGVFFTVLTAAQVLLAVSFVAHPQRRLVLGAAVLEVAVVLLWGVSRTVGLPFGLAEVEPVGLLDTTASALELVAVVASAVWLGVVSATGPRARPHRNTSRRWNAVLIGGEDAR